MTLAEVLEKSSNIGIAKIAERVGAERFYRMCRVLGFGAKTGVHLPGETAGEVKPLSDLTKVGLAARRPMATASKPARCRCWAPTRRIANGGTLWEPKILLDARPPVKVRRIASERSVRQLQEILEGVAERGTATNAKIPGYRVAGKTGTARRIDPRTHRYSMSAYNASFVGFLPASGPRWTILVLLDEPKGASYYGAPDRGPDLRLARPPAADARGHPARPPADDPALARR